MIADLIKRHEGLRLKPYRDSVGKLTIGYGRNLEDVGITEEEADILRDHDIARVVKGLDEALPWWRGLDATKQNALMDMAFNLGIRGLLGFTKMLAALRRGDWDAAADEALDSKWARQVGQRAHDDAALLRAKPGEP